MRKLKIMIFIICLPLFAYSQQWQQYSDSIFVNFKKNNIEKASHFIELADIELANRIIVKDTLYADYLYRKGVVKSSLGNYDSTLLKQSLDIWNSSTKKNYLKIVKINYFLGGNYFALGNQSQIKVNFDTSHKYFEQCYLLSKKYNFKSNPIFKTILYQLALLNYLAIKDFSKAKKYANEYIECIKKTNTEDFNFDYVSALQFKQDFVNQEKLLKEYLKKYNMQKTNNAELLFNIYFKLFVNKHGFKDRDYAKYLNEIIAYGEKAIDICKSNNLTAEPELSTIYLQLELAYNQLKDNINTEKYRKLNYQKYLKNNNLEFYQELEQLYRDGNYEVFKNKFDELENKFKKENQFSCLLEIYKYSLTLFERSILFSKIDVEKQFETISNNRRTFSVDDNLLFDELLIELYIVTSQFERALEICNNNLNIKDEESKLKTYNYKAACEDALGYKEKAYKTATKNYELAINFYGENDPKLLKYINSLLDLDLMSTNPNSLKLETKALQILYDNILEQTVTAISVWNNLGQAAINRNNNNDALIYFQKSIAIIENTKTINNPNLYLSSLYGIVNTYLLQDNFDSAKEYLNKYKKHIDDNPNIMPVMNEGYYSSLGNFYFYQDNFLEAKVNYEKSFTYYDSKNSSKKIRYYLCLYFLNNNDTELSKYIQDFQKENNETLWGSEILYLLKYNSGDFIGAKNLLVQQIDKLIVDNKQYFHLLSDFEKEVLYKSFINQFEFLNSYLLENDPTFLEKYINFRFYSKSLLFSNSFKINGENERNKELYIELKNNTTQINKALEIKLSDVSFIKSLKNKNKEIEKFLSVNTKPITVPTLKDLKSKLTDNEAYVEIIRINKQSRNSTKKSTEIINFFTDSISYGAIVIKKNLSPKFVLIDGSNQLEKQYASSFKSKIQTKQEDLESYHLLFEKIDNELKDVKKIYLVTDGVYNSINIESIYNPNKKQYLIDYLKIQPIQNVRSITDANLNSKVRSITKAVLFGNPDFDLMITDAKINDFLLERSLDNDILNEIKSNVKIGRLDGTQKEIETLDAILRASKSAVTMYSKITATEDNLKDVQSPGILHIATHGYFLKNDDTSKTKQSIANLINDNYKNDSYLKSGLLLAGAQNTLNGKQPENSNNGILTAEEAKSLNLKDTELVVLSACETGLGDNLVGEGVIGLQRAFMIAGAKNVIMSLWSVSDEKTQELMTLFYTNWIKNNMSKTEALYQAKLEIKKIYPEPYYWAGFILLE